jgi:hypothetical protein
MNDEAYDDKHNRHACDCEQHRQVEMRGKRVQAIHSDQPRNTNQPTTVFANLKQGFHLISRKKKGPNARINRARRHYHTSHIAGHNVDERQAKGGRVE